MATTTSKPVLHYLDIGSLGRGEVVRLFLVDAGIEFQDKRYAFDDTWSSTSADLESKGVSRTGLVPVLEYNGVYLSQHMPMLRFLARELGSYDGESSADKYLVDTVADIYIDWRAEWVSNLKTVTDQYKNKVAPEYYNLVAKYYKERDGPFLLGNKITYADFAIYQSIDNDEKIGTLPGNLPDSILALKKAMEARPKVAAYLGSGRKITT
ncbi:glutathione S-transferase [Hirsutella rhossiliensis]|uniref:Glutathione S-transferase n=1 Tax=Hirsutella rhossiliensis TaxID=111463 RepID=A0A9P8SDT7_9HYPO|nr:glutathione S-transferase [Hirsutella rhossiliensis]KAH0958951.1 glutathione S-transferase [Hirsutella rhossiliensis]